jgi:hypothetical protein
MNELTNKDGVPIRVGQCWRCNDEDRGDWEVVGLHSLTDDGPPLVIIWEIGFGDYCHAKTASWFNECMLFSDPTLGDMSEWRIVTAEEREKYPVPACAEFFHTEKALWYGTWSGGSTSWKVGDADEHTTFRVPLNFDFEAEHEGASFICRDCGKEYFHSKDARYCCPTPECNKAAKVCECERCDECESTNLDPPNEWGNPKRLTQRCRQCGNTWNLPKDTQPTAPETLEFELSWNSGYPYFDKGKDIIWPTSLSWHGFVKDGAAYTRLGFKFKVSRSGEYFTNPVTHENKATHIVFKRTEALT